jgi:FtsH-binding integral membrane protein
VALQAVGSAMADVFISYAKTDRPLALKLATMLEAEGWKVWWDTSLTIGDDFRNEIMTELGRARAVIVIWTDASIKSDWVRSEAGRAQADRKLIPIKLEHLTYKDLPPPFDVLHTENVNEDDKIRAAVVAQLAKPAVELSAWAFLTKGFKYEVLTWFGIVGGALTLFGNLDAVLKLADWARVLVHHWKEWTHAFWVWTFGWVGIHLEPKWVPVLTFLSFGSLLTMGQALQFKRRIKDQANVDKSQQKSFRLNLWRSFVCVISMPASLFIWVIADNYLPEIGEMALLVALIAPLVIIVLLSRERLHAALSVFLTVIFFMIIAMTQFKSMLAGAGDDISSISRAVVITVYLTWLLPVILLSVAPAKAVSRRLLFLAIGLLLLIALNELSKLGLDVIAPKLQS